MEPPLLIFLDPPVCTLYVYVYVLSNEKMVSNFFSTDFYEKPLGGRPHSVINL